LCPIRQDFDWGWQLKNIASCYKPFPKGQIYPTLVNDKPIKQEFHPYVFNRHPSLCGPSDRFDSWDFGVPFIRRTLQVAQALDYFSGQ
jgi:hypothetical protein